MYEFYHLPKIGEQRERLVFFFILHNKNYKSMNFSYMIVLVMNKVELKTIIKYHQEKTIIN